MHYALSKLSDWIQSVYLLIFIFLFFLIFFSSEVSNHTHLAVTRAAFHSIYLYKLFNLQFSDIIIIFGLLLSLTMVFLRKEQLSLSINMYNYLLIWCISFIGYFYSLFQGMIILKYFLYDIKVLLYFIFGYILSNQIIRSFNIKTYNLILLIIVLWMSGAFFDAYIIKFFYGKWRVEYPSLLGLIPLSGVIDLSILFCILLKKKSKYILSICSFFNYYNITLQHG